jgi:hypothetical protein
VWPAILRRNADRIAAGAQKAAIVAAKLLVTGACFWYVSRQVDWHQVSSAIQLMDFRWAAFATFMAIMLIPLTGTFTQAYQANRRTAIERLDNLQAHSGAKTSPRNRHIWLASAGRQQLMITSVVLRTGSPRA